MLNLVWDRSERLWCERLMRAQTIWLYKISSTECPSEEGQISCESGVWELKQIECTRGIVQGVHLNWNMSVSLVCESLNRWTLLEKLYRVSIRTGTGERLGVWQLKQIDCGTEIVQGVHLNWNKWEIRCVRAETDWLFNRNCTGCQSEGGTRS
jgi:hypothetical protein